MAEQEQILEDTDRMTEDLERVKKHLIIQTIGKKRAQKKRGRHF